MSDHSYIRPIAVDLFAGAGGMSLGFEQAGFDVLAAVEIDPIHGATHEYNFPLCRVICQSVTELTGAEIRQCSQIGDRPIDVVFGGPPCQGFSLMGKRHLADPRNQLALHFLRLVGELQPKYFVLENVPGITVGKQQIFLQEIINKLRFHGYQIVEPYQILNAANYGVPQQRKRLFLLGCQLGLNLPQYPLNLDSKITVWEAIGDLPEAENYQELWIRDWVYAKFQQPSIYSSNLRSLVSRADDYSYPRNHNNLLLTASILTKHTQETRTRFARTEWGKLETISRFYKLSPQGLCNTLRAGTASDRGSFTAPRPIHPLTPRCITVREAARLHSYPDWFRFHVTKWHGFRQIGNSVPPRLAQAVASEIIKALESKVSKPNKSYDLGEEKLLQLKMSQATQYYRKAK